jgi:hypothetical protein
VDPRNSRLVLCLALGQSCDLAVGRPNRELPRQMRDKQSKMLAASLSDILDTEIRSGAKPTKKPQSVMCVVVYLYKQNGRFRAGFNLGSTKL